MADYGLKVWDSSGNVKLELTDRITRLRYTHEAAAGESDSVVLSDIDGLQSVEIAIPAESDVGEAVPEVGHTVIRSGTTISWTAHDGTEYDSAKSLIFVFLYT